jgi:hypothetical protein
VYGTIKKGAYRSSILQESRDKPNDPTHILIALDEANPLPPRELPNHIKCKELEPLAEVAYAVLPLEEFFGAI